MARLSVRLGALVLAAGLAAPVAVAQGQAASPPRIAFAAGPAPGPAGGIITRSIYTAGPDGSARTRLTTRSDSAAPAWSPDRSRIAFVSDLDSGGSQYDLYTMNADGSGVTRLTDTAEHEGHPSWSPDGTRLVFSRGRAERYRIVVASATGGGEKEIANDGFAPSWSPDGTKIVFSSWEGNRLTITTPNGGTRTRLIASSGLGYEHSPAWSPDGKKIAFVGGPEDIYQVHVVGVDGKGLKRLTPPRTETGSPTFSADGARILYVENHTILASIKPDGTGRTVVFQGNEWLADIAVQRGPMAPAPTTTTTDRRGCMKNPRWQVYGDHWELHGGPGMDVLCGADGRSDYLFGRNGNDTLYGGSGNDWLHGGPGRDFLYGEAGDDHLEDDGGGGLLVGGAGDDRLRTLDRGRRSPNNVVSGGPGDDMVCTEDGMPDTVDGGAGTDRGWWDKEDVVKNVEIRLTGSQNNLCTLYRGPR